MKKVLPIRPRLKCCHSRIHEVTKSYVYKIFQRLLQYTAIMPSLDCFRSKRYAFLFDKQFLLCKAKGETFEIKEKLDLKKFKIDSEVPNSGRGKVCVGSRHSCEACNGSVFDQSRATPRAGVTDLRPESG